GRPDWGVVVQKPEDRAFASVEKMIRATVEWGGIALLAAILAAVAFASGIASPIRMLADRSREIAAGNYAQRVEVKSHNGIDDRILRKPGALSDDEFEVMKGHPVKGAAIMSGVAQLIDVIPGMKYHHEKWGGGGYPDGLESEQIPMQARIVAIADTFDAMT